MAEQRNTLAERAPSQAPSSFQQHPIPANMLSDYPFDAHPFMVDYLNSGLQNLPDTTPLTTADWDFALQNLSYSFLSPLSSGKEDSQKLDYQSWDALFEPEEQSASQIMPPATEMQIEQPPLPWEQPFPDVDIDDSIQYATTQALATANTSASFNNTTPTQPAPPAPSSPPPPSSRLVPVRHRRQQVRPFTSIGRPKSAEAQANGRKPRGRAAKPTGIEKKYIPFDGHTGYRPVTKPGEQVLHRPDCPCPSCDRSRQSKTIPDLQLNGNFPPVENPLPTSPVSIPTAQMTPLHSSQSSYHVPPADVDQPNGLNETLLSAGSTTKDVIDLTLDDAPPASDNTGESSIDDFLIPLTSPSLAKDQQNDQNATAPAPSTDSKDSQDDDSEATMEDEFNKFFDEQEGTSSAESSNHEDEDDEGWGDVKDQLDSSS